MNKRKREVNYWSFLRKSNWWHDWCYFNAVNVWSLSVMSAFCNHQQRQIEDSILCYSNTTFRLHAVKKIRKDISSLVRPIIAAIIMKKFRLQRHSLNWHIHFKYLAVQKNYFINNVLNSYQTSFVSTLNVSDNSAVIGVLAFSEQFLVLSFC